MTVPSWAKKKGEYQIDYIQYAILFKLKYNLNNQGQQWFLCGVYAPYFF